MIVEDRTPDLTSGITRDQGNSNDEEGSQEWMSFACKSVEIVNTKTVMSRNNTQLEVYQYGCDESTFKDESALKKDPEVQPPNKFLGLEKRISEQIREGVDDYLAMKEDVISFKQNEQPELMSFKEVQMHSKDLTYHAKNSSPHHQLSQEEQRGQCFLHLPPNLASFSSFDSS